MLALSAERREAWAQRRRLAELQRRTDGKQDDRRVARAIRRSIGDIVADRSIELGSCEHSTRSWVDKRGRERRISCRCLPATWKRWAIRFDSCDYARVWRNPLSGTEVAFPFSDRIPGCPHDEQERVAKLHRRYLPLVGRGHHVLFVVVAPRNVPAGQLRARQDQLAAAAARVFRSSPLGRGKTCRAAKIGCLADVDAAARRRCGRRCHRGSGPRHLACRPCPGHQPITAGLVADETTFNWARGDWHAHLNALLDGPYLRKAALEASFALALGEPDCHIYIREAARAPRGHEGSWSLEHALRETVKYSIKADRQLVDRQRPAPYIEWAEARQGRRTLRSYGDWFNAGDQDDDQDDDVADETEPHTDDAGTVYRLPVLDPLTDSDTDWELVPGDARRSRFVAVTPPGRRHTWFVGHPALRVDDG